MDFQKLFRPGILQTSPYSAGRPIEEVQRELGLSDVIKLASNENPEGPLPEVVAAICQAAQEVNRYPDAAAWALTRALAAHLGVAPAAILLGNGSNETFDMLVRALVSPGENVVYGHPSFIVYKLTTDVHFQTGRAVPLDAHDRHDLPAMARAVDAATKLVVLCNPNNPTGTYTTDAELRGFLQALPPTVIVALDEAYCEYATAPDFPQTVPLLAAHPNLVLLRTFSKIHSLAGLRLGYAVGHPDLIAELHKTREPFNVNSLAQAAGLACLARWDEVAARAGRNRRELEGLERQLKALKLRVTPSQANFLLVRVPGQATEVTAALLKRGIIVRPMAAFGLGDGAIRISVGLPAENARLVRALEEILA
ncbi:MAG: histidinol-phosphate transaminase [Candidatus Krumholzibacteriia bacterium]